MTALLTLLCFSPFLLLAWRLATKPSRPSRLRFGVTGKYLDVSKTYGMMEE